MARMKKAEVIAELTSLGVAFKASEKYNDLCNLLKRHRDSNDDGDRTNTATPTQLKITNRLKKRPTFLADAVRDQRDDEFLNRELSKREHKGKILRTTRIKEYEVSDDGYWVTSFIIDLKD